MTSISEARGGRDPHILVVVACTPRRDELGPPLHPLSFRHPAGTSMSAPRASRQGARRALSAPPRRMEPSVYPAGASEHALVRPTE